MSSVAHTPRTADGLGAYFLLTYLISWTCWGALIVFQIPGGSVHPDAPPPPPLGLALLGVGILAPSLAGVFLTWRMEGSAGLHDLWRRMTAFRLGWRPYAVIFGVPLTISLLRIAVHLARGGVFQQSPLLAQPGLLIPFTIQILVFGPLMEEPGWRGFALDRMLARWGFLPASLILGSLHGLWHLPAFFIVGTIQQSWGNPLLEFGLFWAGTLGGALIFTWLHVASRGSVWAAILFHATVNFGISLLWTLYDGGTLDRSILIVLMSAVAVLIVWLTRNAGARRGVAGSAIATAYTSRTASLLREFDESVRRIRGLFIARYGEATADRLIAEARDQYATLIPQLPYLGGQQPFTRFVIGTAWFLSLYRVLKQHGYPVEEAGLLVYESSEALLKARPAFLRRLFGSMNFTRAFLRRVRLRAAESQQRQYAGNYVFEFVEGDGRTFDYGIDYLECGACKFLQAQGAPELAPYVCAVDQIYSDLLGWGLRRTTTLVEGGARCDFRFRRGGPTRVAVPAAIAAHLAARSRTA